MDMSVGKLQALVMDREAWHVVHGGHRESDTTEQLTWTELCQKQSKKIKTLFL